MNRFLEGRLHDLLEVRRTVGIPVLRKDFMIDLYQIHEAKAYGADAMLLIAACLNDRTMQHLADEAINLGLSILFEVHDLEELKRVATITQDFDQSQFVIGVNNRDLKRFETNVQNSHELLGHFPKGVLAVSESGFNDPKVVAELQKAGFSGFLIGEHFMKTNDPGLAVQTLLKEQRYDDKGLRHARYRKYQPVTAVGY